MIAKEKKFSGASSGSIAVEAACILCFPSRRSISWSIHSWHARYPGRVSRRDSWWNSKYPAGVPQWKMLSDCWPRETFASLVAGTALPVDRVMRMIERTVICNFSSRLLNTRLEDPIQYKHVWRRVDWLMPGGVDKPRIRSTSLNILDARFARLQLKSSNSVCSFDSSVPRNTTVIHEH